MTTSTSGAARLSLAPRVRITAKEDGAEDRDRWRTRLPGFAASTSHGFSSASRQMDSRIAVARAAFVTPAGAATSRLKLCSTLTVTVVSEDSEVIAAVTLATTSAALRDAAVSGANHSVAVSTTVAGGNGGGSAGGGGNDGSGGEGNGGGGDGDEAVGGRGIRRSRTHRGPQSAQSWPNRQWKKSPGREEAPSSQKPSVLRSQTLS